MSLKKPGNFVFILTLITITVWIGRLPAIAAVRPYIPDHVNGIWLSTGQIVNGGVLAVEIDATRWPQPVHDLTIRFREKKYSVYRHPLGEAGLYFSLVAIPFRSKPGKAKLTVQWVDFRGQQSAAVEFRVTAGKYRSEELTVDSRRVTPPKKDRDRAQREYREIQRIYSEGIAAKLWNGNFALPLNTVITSPFGNSRTFNGSLKSYHNGIDFRAPVGTPVFAANAGTVRLAKNLFYSGNAVIIDHGTGLFSIYAHLNALHVADNQRVAKGQSIGLSGATGRVSGPHLHWGVKINGIAVDPLVLVDVINALMAGPEP